MGIRKDLDRFSKDLRRKYQTTDEFLAAHGWTPPSLRRSDRKQQQAQSLALIDQLHGEPFHPPEWNPPPGTGPYPVLGRHEHKVSDMMRGTHLGRSAIVFTYTRRQEVLDDTFGRRGWEAPEYWIVALLDLPAPVTYLQVTPRTPTPPAQPGIAVGDPRIDKRFHVHTADPSWAARVLPDLAPVLLSPWQRLAEQRR